MFKDTSAEITFSEKINKQISFIVESISSAPDIKDDILPFLNKSLVKLNKLTQYDDVDGTHYEITQIVFNLLPKTLDAYLSLPIDYRNTKNIRGEQTARQILIGDIKNIKSQINNIENKLFSTTETAIKVNSRIIEQKSELNPSDDDTFNNTFDIKSYKEPSLPTIQNKLIQQISKIANVENKEKITLYLNKTFDTLVPILKKISLITKNNLINLYRKIKLINWDSNATTILPVIFGGLGIFGIIFLFNLMVQATSNNTYVNNSLSFPKDFYSVSVNNSMTKANMNYLLSQKIKELNDISHFSSREISLIDRGEYFEYKLNKIDKNDCIEVVDSHSFNYPEIPLLINTFNIVVNKPSFSEVRPGNYSACSLNENTISFYFSTDILNKIKNISKTEAEERINSLKELNNDIAKLQEQKNAPHYPSYYKDINDHISEQINIISKYHPTSN